MKNYIKPTVSLVEMQSNENIALNPASVSVNGATNAMETTYDLSAFTLVSLENG